MRSVYFSNQVKSEQNMYEDLIIESLQIYGEDIIYIPRTEITRDEILNESYSRFGDAYTVEMYIENQEGFEGDGELLSKFGLEIRDTATFIVAKRRWEKQIGKWGTAVRPMEGDLIYLPLSNSLFEIKFVEHEQPFYQLNNLPIFKLQAELFEYGGNEIEINTGIDQLDTTYNYELDASGTGTFIDGENVIQWSGANNIDDVPINIEGEVVSFDSNELNITRHSSTDGRFRMFYASSTNLIVGTESGATYMVVDSINTYNINDLNDNDFFQTEADNIIDFSETNPFGEP